MGNVAIGGISNIEQIRFLENPTLNICTSTQKAQTDTKESINALQIKRELFNRLFPVEEKDGFYMNQKIGNCYLIAAINVMRLNPSFMDKLYKNIRFTKENNILKTKVFYTFPDGEEVSVSLKDLKIQQEERKEFQIEKLEDYAHEILMYIVKNKEDFIEELEQDNYIEDFIDSDGKKRIYFKDDFINEIYNQLLNQNGKYYEIFIQDKKYPSVDASIGYKILEALYTKKKKFKKRKKTISGSPMEVLQMFLGREKWDFKFYDVQEVCRKEVIIDTLMKFNLNDYIINIFIKDIRSIENFTPYFGYNNYKMADGHAYSVVGFDKENQIVKIVNPWDNNKILDFSLQDFFKIFTGIHIAKKKS